MWLLKLHFSISVLCLMTFLGFRMVYKEQVKENGYVPDEKKKKGLSFYFIFFVPILNILSVFVLLMMIAMKKEDFEKKCEEWKNESTNRE